jgi:uncharacterized protein YdiU (UPF0061 family)
MALRTRMNRVNPKFGLRNYLAETAIRKAEDGRDYREIDTLMMLLRAPFDEHPGFESYADHLPAWAGQLAVSCSSLAGVNPAAWIPKRSTVQLLPAATVA